ncbi:hypothetical protein FNV43_RR25346 [Rhamnella rubrinervis]|uniref:Sulfotransferase n=1 Tax=Rhamnella rubrinervis TaxID=2594499 RepID=A0A8K0DS99_9ROSA|nr:hypothetical protein FNV43_RR25346 [Rhamnella rubrinervis]
MENMIKNSKIRSSSSSIITGDGHHQELQNKIEKLLTTLPREYIHGLPHFQYEGAWYPSMAVPGVISSQQLFQADESDIILATLPKSGTTWLKSLIFSIVNRNRYAPKDSPLLSIHPHDLVCNIELEHFRDGVPQHLEQLSRPRIFNTHVPYASLPSSIMASNCRIVCVCRNPMDNIVSYWHFVSSIYKSFFIQPNPIDELFDKYCQGVHYYGPFWDHNLGYWKASLEKPKNMLFMTYEDLKEDIHFQTKRLAAFLGFPFSKQEEDEGLIEEISRLCSLRNLKSLDINKRGLNKLNLPVSAYFRKGEVGDYANHLTPSMVQKLNKVVLQKFAGSGLVLKLKIQNNSATE